MGGYMQYVACCEIQTVQCFFTLLMAKQKGEYCYSVGKLQGETF